MEVVFIKGIVVLIKGIKGRWVKQKGVRLMSM